MTDEGFEEDQRGPPPSPEGSRGELVLDIEGFEGPIDVLLTLARDQKVDLRHISILQLADQYLQFVAKVRSFNLELAADYLVMAAWLAFLKSRLLLPELAKAEEPSGEEMAAALHFQLQRLQAMQDAGQKLLDRPRLGRDIFPRGEPEGVIRQTRTVFDVTLFELLKAYADHTRRHTITSLEIEVQTLFTVDEALKRLREMLGFAPDWSTLTQFLPEGITDPLRMRSAVSATLVAALELAKQGRLELRQDGPAFSPIYVRNVS